MKLKCKLHYLLVKNLGISKRDAQLLIQDSCVKINNIPTNKNIHITDFDEIQVNDKIIQVAQKPIYIAYYKPRGIECTLNESIEHNLKHAIGIEETIFPLGRLDKESEGLLLLTNDGSICKKLLYEKYHVEKKYYVTVNKKITTEFINALQTGVIIMGKQTLPCKVHVINDTCFEIILIQGLNRQIRRMCYKHNYEVVNLKRIQFANYKLSTLQPGEWKSIQKEEILNF